jgi:hypothetical protein
MLVKFKTIAAKTFFSSEYYHLIARKLFIWAFFFSFCGSNRITLIHLWLAVYDKIRNQRIPDPNLIGPTTLCSKWHTKLHPYPITLSFFIILCGIIIFLLIWSRSHGLVINIAEMLPTRRKAIMDL